MQTIRLPGLYFQTAPPPLPEVLPRMDIAAFVGFAASGPLHVPVAVEDAARFREIFGPDLPLAWDALKGQVQTSYLGAAVEAFFHNGGRRCWVVRVAAEYAERNRFPVPGLIRADNRRPAQAVARSEGSWSDRLQVGAVRHSDPFASRDFVHADAEYSLVLTAAPGEIEHADLLQIGFDRPGELGRGPLLFLAVESIEHLPAAVRVHATQAYWFLRSHPSSLPPAQRVVLLSPDGEEDLPFDSVDPSQESSDQFEVIVPLSLANAPLPGALLRIDFTGGATVLLSITDVIETGDGSPPSVQVHIRGAGALWPVEAGQVLPLLDAEPHIPRVERLSFDLLVWRGQQLVARLGNLAFSAGHTRFWGGLPGDAELFGLSPGTEQPPVPSALGQEAAIPRFPLAGPAPPAPLYLPLAMPRVAHAALAQAALPATGGDSLQRDGLEQFGADTFLDADLAPIGSGALLVEAEHKYYLRNQPLQGLHSLLPLQEVTLVAVPDAVQRSWLQISPPSSLLITAPKLGVESEQQGLIWTQSAHADSYLVQEATDPSFTQPVTFFAGADQAAGLPQRTDCPGAYYYRVRAARGSQISPWSNTVRLVIPLPTFDPCALVVLESPDLQLAPSATQSIFLDWSPVPDATDYRLEKAADPAFLTATTLYTGSNTGYQLEQQGEGVHYYRVRAEENELLSPWSNTVLAVAAPRQRWSMEPPTDYDDADLLAVQRALLRFCAARSDLLALLAVPGHYREDQTLAHVAALSPGSGGAAPTVGPARVHPLTLAEHRILDFGAIYHPWIIVGATSLSTPGGAAAATRAIPPDGAVCGAIAARAIRRGAWVAPANDPLRNVVSLIPDIDREGWERAFAAQINLIRQDPRGFLLLSADTLSPERLVRPINVRRLLILLRRLALRMGESFVFQNNDEILRRRVQHRFQRVLNDLYVRGAFAGNSPETAYRVVTDASVNTPDSVDRARFIVELRVAPSHPLAFITVRLVQTENGSLALQER